MAVMLNWLVIGIGDITTKRVIPAIQEEPRSVLYGVLSRDPQKGSRYAAHVWTDLTEALRDPAVGAVYVASPVFLHARQTIAALRAGKHVLCEKPTAMNYAEACEMARVAAETGRTLGVAYYRRNYPKVHRALALLKQGVIGRPVLAEINCHDWFNDEARTRSWLLDPAQSGAGPLFDIASHRIDILNFFFGRPWAVSAHLANVVHRNPVEDCATLLIEYDSGVRGIADVRWHSRQARDEFRIVGTEGEMELSPLNGPPLSYPGGSEEIPTHTNVHYPCVHNFVEAVLDGAPLASSGESAMWTDWVTEEALRRNATRLVR